VLGAGYSVPAQAASSFSFNASPEPVKKGAYVTLSGSLSGTVLRDHGQSVLFYFRASGSTAWVYQHAAWVRNAKFSKRIAQNHSGTWKAVASCECDSTEPGPSRTDYVPMKGTQLPGVVSAGHGYYVTYKPSTLELSGSGSWYFTRLRWTKLSRTTGYATAIEHSNDCEPNCAEGTFRTRKVTLKFSRVRSHHGAPTFTSVEVVGSPYSDTLLYPAN
jgi:hypothetical protein